MDRERRHQLAQNELRNWLYTQYEDVIKPNGQLIGWLFVAFLVLVCGFFLTRSLLQANYSKSWQQYFTALYSDDPEASFQALVEDRSSAKGSAAAQIRLTYAQILSSGAEVLLATDKTKAVEQWEKSAQMFQAALDLADNDGIRQRAVYGSAVTYETLAAHRIGNNDLAESEKKYKELVDRWPDSLYGQWASKRLVQLAKSETRAFYDFIAVAVPATQAADHRIVDIDRTDFFFDGPGDFDPLKILDSITPSQPLDTPLENTEDNQDIGIPSE